MQSKVPALSNLPRGSALNSSRFGRPMSLSKQRPSRGGQRSSRNAAKLRRQPAKPNRPAREPGAPPTRLRQRQVAHPLPPGTPRNLPALLGRPTPRREPGNVLRHRRANRLPAPPPAPIKRPVLVRARSSFPKAAGLRARPASRRPNPGSRVSPSRGRPAASRAPR